MQIILPEILYIKGLQEKYRSGKSNSRSSKIQLTSSCEFVAIEK